MNSSSETKMNKLERISDKLLYGFIVLFIATLHNSIFINQIGYYGALLVLIFKGIYNRKNPFQKSGLELFFLLFILAELLSAIFSVAPANSFQNLLKRVLLIPIVYVITSAADSRQKALTFLKLYVGAAFMTLIAYIAFAYEHFIHQLYQLETKGPSPFQYVMTAGGLISFTVIILFSFIINEKSWRTRIIVSIVFLISLIALAASYTRAAWLGAAAGMFIILVIKKKWIIITPLIFLLGWFMMTQKTTSSLVVQDSLSDSIVSQIRFPGKLLSVFPDTDNVYLSGYEKGVLLYQGSELKPVISTAAPVNLIAKWTDNVFLAYLTDHRVEIYNLESDEFKKINEIISPGNTSAIAIASDKFYVMDIDSGLTVFTDPMNSTRKFRFPELKGILRLAVNYNFLAAYSRKDNLLQVFKLEGGLPSKSILKKNYNTDYGFVSLIDNHLIFSTEKETELMLMENNSVRKIETSNEFSNIVSFVVIKGKLFAYGFRPEFLQLKYPVDGGLDIVKKHSLKEIPTSISFNGDSIYYTAAKISRLNSIFDPYHSTNIQRMYQWQAGIEIVKDYPLFGVGDIDMKVVYSKYKNYFEKELFGHLHNNYIQLLAALGIIGFLIVITLLVKILLVHFRIYRSVGNNSLAASYSLGALGAYVGFLVSGLAEWNFGDHEIITVVWFFLGLNLAFGKLFSSKDQDNNQEN